MNFKQIYEKGWRTDVFLLVNLNLIINLFTLIIIDIRKYNMLKNNNLLLNQ